jgi:glycosyltransferase involved in cell wall biosynthesis
MIPRYSIIISCYREEQSIEEFMTRLVAAIEASGREIEIVAVNDGSDDGTFAKLSELLTRYRQVAAVIDLFRNSGQAAGLTAGLSEARGENFVLLDSDLQLDPEELPKLLAKFEEGYDIVSGYRLHRRDPLRRRIYSRVANSIMRKASGADFRDFGCTFKVYDGRLVRAFDLGRQRVLNQIDLVSAAQKTAEVPVSHHPRRYGRSGWSLSRLLDLNTDHMLDLSRRPFQYVAASTALLALFMILRVVLDPWISRVFLSEVSHGLLLNAIVIAMLVTLAVQALAGELVLRSFVSLRRNPGYIVREIVRREDVGGG